MSHPTNDTGTDRHDALLARLRALPERDVDARVSSPVERRARRILAEQRALAQRPMARLAEAWGRALLPVAMVGTACVYLVWMLQFTAALYR